MLNRRSLLRGLVGGSALGGVAGEAVGSEPQPAIQDWHLDVVTLERMFNDDDLKSKPRNVDFRTITALRDGDRIIERIQWSMRRRIDSVLESFFMMKHVVPFRVDGESFAFMCRARRGMRQKLNGRWRRVPAKLFVQYLLHNPADDNRKIYTIGAWMDFATMDDCQLAKFNEVNSLLRRIGFIENPTPADEIARMNSEPSTLYQMRWL